MLRFGYKSLLVALFIFAGTVPLAAYYYSPDNQPPGTPPNYNQIDPEYFYGVPSLAELGPAEMDGYFMYFDSVETRWSIMRAIPFGTYAYEQFHGSMLVQLDGEPEPGVNVWPQGFDLTDDLHRNDRWGWVKWPDSIAPNLYEVWWDITIECPEPVVNLTRTIGFWKNHTGVGPQDDLVSQFLPISLGTADGAKSLLVSDVQIAFDVLSMSLIVDQLDGISKLRAQLLAAKLDIASGTDGTVVADVIELADLFLADHEPADWWSLDDATRQMVLDWKNILDSYNNGYIGPGHDDGNIIVDCGEDGCPPCVVGMSFSGCAFDFNLWSSSYNQVFSADKIYLGEQRMPLSTIPGYLDTFEGIDDPYGHPFDCPDSPVFNKLTGTGMLECNEPNLSVFAPVMFPGAAYNADGMIVAGDEYGDSYSGSRVYEGNGIQFSLNDCGENNPPEFDPPVGYLKPVRLCLDGTIYDTIVANDFDPGAYVTLTQISGPGDFTSTPGAPPVYGYFSWTPTASGEYAIVFEAVDNFGASVIDSIIYDISFNTAPDITAQDTTIVACWGLQQICYTVPVFDPDDDSLTFTLISGMGEINPVTGEICFTPEVEGEYSFEVEVADSCAFDTAMFTVTVTLNNDPWINPYDTIIALCETDTICFDVTAFDPDPGDSLEINFVSGPGEFNQTGNGVGTHCFLPDGIDSARYVFVYNVTDNCWRESFKTSTPPVPTDSIVIIVITEEPPVITCPDGPIMEFLCGPDSLCVEIPIEPADAIITVLEQGAVYENGKLCFYADEPGIYEFTLVASNECGDDTCVVTFDVNMDEAPQLTCPPSQSIHLCEAGDISLPLGWMPESAVITIVPEAEYADGLMTFFAGEPGDYEFTVSAETGCGVDSCNFTITVTFDSPPVVTISDSTLLLCELEEICIPFSYSDPDGNVDRVIIQPVSFQKVNDSIVCFTPFGSGDYEIIVTVTDSCQNYTSDTAIITVELNQEPTVTVGDDSFFLCEPTEVCLPVTMFDPDSKIESVIISEPGYLDAENGQVCLPVSESGNYQIIVTVYDDCGAMAVDTGVAEVTFGAAPIIYCPPSGAMHLCGPDSISVPLSVVPVSTMLNISPEAMYADGMLTFFADEPGEYCFEVSAGSDCGADTCNFCITVTMDSPPTVTIADTVVYLCEFEEICLPYSYHDPDGNVVSVTVAGMKDYLDPSQTEGEVCFVPWRKGINELEIIVTDACGHSAYDTSTVIVVYNMDPQASLENATFNLCEPDNICMPLTMSDRDGVIDSVVVMAPAYYDADNQRVCMPVDETNLYQITAIVYDDCGASAIATAIARVIVNYTPEATVPNDTTVFLCELSEICLDGFEFLDRNQNLANIEFTPDIGTYTDGRYCFMPEGEGTFMFVVRATDSCGALDEDTINVTVELGEGVVIDCPVEIPPMTLCGPDSVCLDMPISPVTAEVRIVEEGAAYADGRLCFYADESGTYTYTVIATGDCGEDTCQVSVDITIDEAPQIVCPPSDTIDLCGPEMISVPLGYSPESAELLIDPQVEYSDGMLHFMAEEPGDYCFDVVASNSCGADTCHFCITVTFNSPPELAVTDSTLFLCAMQEICVPVSYSDPDGDTLAVIFSPEGLFELRDGEVCLNADAPGTYEYSIQVTDPCGLTIADTGTITVTLNEGPTVVVPDSSIFLCTPSTICLPVTITDPDEDIDSIIVSEPAYYDSEKGVVCLEVAEAGTYEITVTVYDDCGEMATDMGTITAEFGTFTQITCPESQTIHLCEPEMISLPLGVVPSNATVTIDPAIEYADGMISFMPDTAGMYCFTAIAESDCGADSCGFCITVEYDSPPTITATDSTVNLCESEEICIPFTVSDPDDNIDTVTVSPDIFSIVDGKVCFTPVESGTFNYYLSVMDECGNPDTAMGVIEVNFNQGPSVEVGDDSVFICEPTIVCLPIMALDNDGVIDSVIVSEPWYYNPDTSGVCREVSESGVYDVTVTVYDDCGASASMLGTAVVTLNSAPIVTLPADTSLFLCEPQQLCFPFEVTDIDNNLADITVLPEGFEITDGDICFFADELGVHEVILTATDSCGVSDADTFMVTVAINEPPAILVGDTTLFSCEPLEVCVQVNVADTDGDIDSVIVSMPAYYNEVNGTVCLPVEESGSFDITVTVYDDCGAPNSDIATFDVTINSTPVVDAPADSNVFVCTPGEICLDGFEIFDVDQNIVNIEFMPDLGTYVEGTYCFMPDQEGQYCFVVRATDECGLVAEDTVCVNYQLGTDAVIACPEGIQPVSLCSPDSVCFEIAIEPATAIVSVLEQDAVYADGKLCFFAEGEGLYTYTIVAQGDCGADTCQVTFDVSLMAGPQLTCPQIDSMHLCDPGMVSVPLGVMPGTAIVTTTPEAEYADGMLTFMAEGPGEYCFEVVATNECGSDTCNFCLTITMDSPPVVTISDTTLFLCNLEEICLPYQYSDPDDNVVSVTVGPNKFDVTDGLVCYTPIGAGTEEIYITVTDSCGHSAVDTATIVITLNQDPQVTVGDTAVFLCDPAVLCVPVSAFDSDGTIDSIVVVEPAYYDTENGTVCMSVSESGNHEAIVMAYDDCGVVAVDTGIITVRYNFPPMVDAPANKTVLFCEPTEICLDGFVVIDIDRNLESIQFTPDIGTFNDGTYCFTPQEAGEYCIVMRATDSCGAIGVDTVCVSVIQGSYVSLACPEGIIERSICEPDTVCIDVPVTPADADVIVLEDGGYYSGGQLCFFADHSGTYIYTVIATGDCNADTCVVTVDLSLGELPVITCPEPRNEHLCGPDSISVPLTISPADAELQISPDASYANGMLTFYADTEGEYCFEVIAYGPCGDDTCNFCVTVTFDDPPLVSVTDSTMYLCNLEEICIPVDISDPDNNIKTIEIYPPEYSLVDNAVCFTPTATGTYEIIVTVTDSCDHQTVDTGTVDLSLNPEPSVIVHDSTIFLCETGDVCLAVEMSDPDGTIDSIEVSEPAYYDAANQRVCLAVDVAGSYEITVTVYDDCGASATDAGTATVMINTGPTVEFGPFDSPLYLCDLTEVCLPIIVGDAEGNIVSLTGSTTCGGGVTFNEAQDVICWAPNTFGPCTITVFITDDCGVSDTATAEVELIESPGPRPPCPDDTTIFVCTPGQQTCVDLGDIQPGSNITIRPSMYSFVPDLGQLCYFPSGDQSDLITVIDSTECGIDSCQFVLTTVMNRPPVITGEAPGEIEFCHEVNICIDYAASDPDNNIETIRVLGDCTGVILDAANNRVCLEITTEVDCTLDIIAIDVCGLADTLTIPIVATPNQPPAISLPDIETVVRCNDDDTPIFIADICVGDGDYDEVTLVMDSGLGEFSFNPVFNCGDLTFTPPTNDTAQYCFRFRAEDACDTVYETWCLNVLPALVCSTCIEVSIEDRGCTNSGQVTSVDIIANVTNDIAAYDMLIAYDASALSFLRANIGTAIEGWEYFTYRFGDQGNCEAPCPSGLIRMVAIADVNNGPFHPPAEQLNPDGTIASITFRVSNDLNLGGQNIPIQFFWMDCGDNGFSDPTGQYLYVDNIIYSPEGNIIWDESNDAAYPESARFPHVGVPDECLIGDKFEPVRCISLHNGYLCITHPDSIDARGDLNLNGVAYEIADAVVYTNYFISGLSAFTISVAGQIAASDVNADGMTLSIADLVYLIRVIIGDAPPYPKKLINSDPVIGICSQTGSKATVSLDSEHDVGAALLIFNCEGGTPNEPVLAEAAEGMEIKSGWLNDEFRVLVYSFEAGAMIKAGTSDLVNISMSEGGTIELVELDVADYYGRVLGSEIGNAMLPLALELSQNQPNPFNPTTTFSMALPTASDYNVTIFNITGQVVKRWIGYAEAGYITFEWNGRDENGQTVASGIYFYRAQAVGTEAIKKMILLK